MLKREDWDEMIYNQSKAGGDLEAVIILISLQMIV
jgi:hypothetical protein